MSQTNTVARSLHDVGLATWFGGSLMGAVALNGSAAAIKDASERERIATLGWKRWAPVNATAIAVHLVGGALVTRANKGRLVAQAGVGTLSGVKAAVTVAALLATGAAGYFGNQIDQAGSATPVEGATEATVETSDAVAHAQKALLPLQWAIPVLTGTLLVLNARMGEQQRPAQVASGILGRLLPE